MSFAAGVSFPRPEKLRANEGGARLDEIQRETIARARVLSCSRDSIILRAGKILEEMSGEGRN